MKILENISLKRHNTFGIDVKARYFAIVETEYEVVSLINSGNYDYRKILVLGSGSNILFTKDYDGMVIKLENRGVSIIKEDQRNVWIRSQAGELWDDLVVFSLDHHFSGLENLSYIPGTVGAAPIQNIGAYGAELKDTLEEIRALDLKNGEIRIFRKNDCDFNYRSSVFKKELKKQYILLSMVFKLSKNHEINVSYPGLKKELTDNGISAPTLSDVRNAVISLRKRKLPDPHEIGNAGSFFKNPAITRARIREIKEKFTGITVFEMPDATYKISAGWMIEQCGYKGKSYETHGVYDKQALILINKGGAVGADIVKLADEIKTAVFEKFNILLEEEVVIL